ncbi:MAG: superoxide dismutase [Candidatus Tectomicrobia bacterium]|nr:superoxide dismutase [Candidatus Tectomicrobia bacterium]
MAFQLPKLEYAYNALEPHIDARTMEIHHTKHHQTYINNVNAALEKLGGKFASISVEELLANVGSVPEASRGAVNFNGGGTDNHNIFWKNMKPGGGGEPKGAVADAIQSAFKDFPGFKDQFSKAAVGVQGSGWCWLVYDPKGKKIAIKTMPNQTSPRTEGLIPLLGVDVWEHAYYLNYQNRRADYVAAWWNVINWDDVNARLAAAKK